MGLQWMILTYVVAAEAVMAVLITLPSPKALKSTLVSLISLILQPSMFIVPFASFQLLGFLTFYLFCALNQLLILTFVIDLLFMPYDVPDIYWKNEHRLMCSGEACTAAERDRYEKSVIVLLNPNI